MKFTFIHSLEELGTDLRVGVSLNNGKEISLSLQLVTFDAPKVNIYFHTTKF